MALVFVPQDAHSLAVSVQQVIERPAVYSTTTVASLIDNFATKYGVDKDMSLAIANCESQFRHSVYGDHGKAYSVYQFHRPTFDHFAKVMGEKLNYDDPYDHIKLANWSFAQGNEYLNDWTCAVKLGYAHY